MFGSKMCWNAEVRGRYRQETFIREPLPVNCKSHTHTMWSLVTGMC